MRVLHTADWHLGDFKGPELNGVNLRGEATISCIDEMIKNVEHEELDLALISGDIFHRAEVWQGRSHREVLQARKRILELSKIAKTVIVMRGTPNHDSAEAFEELKAHFELTENVHIVTTPQVINCGDVDVAVLPGFDRGVFRAKFPGLSKEEENEVFTNELSNIVMMLRAQCTAKRNILMAHYTVPGCNTESGQEMQLTNFEPIIRQDTLRSADFDLVALGHIHRPQQLPFLRNAFYSGAVNTLNFNDEGQDRGYWVHNVPVDGDVASVFTKLSAALQFKTLNLDNEAITQINQGNMAVITENVEDMIVRVRYSCTYENNKALNKIGLENYLYDKKAFWVAEIMADKIGELVDRNSLSQATDPEENLRKYLDEKYMEFSEEKKQELIIKARPIIQQAEASTSLSANSGTFTPISIEVKNYRNYAEETFDFSNISFCTINGVNGAGKSSLFMDAIVDCLFEEPREGDLTGWIRKDGDARSGSIIFTFSIGDKTYRVTRTRARSGKGTLNLSEFVSGEWINRSAEKYKDTQDIIIRTLGMDSMTLKSCALIMQDQYGLFLEAKKEDRMAILGSLLGLSIYDAMMKLSGEQAKIYGAKTRDAKQEINIKQQALDSLGNPYEELEERQRMVDAQKQIFDEKSKNVSEKADQLRGLQQVQEQRLTLSREIYTLKSKKAKYEADRLQFEGVIAECNDYISKRDEIEARVRILNDSKEALAAADAQAELFRSKKKAVADASVECTVALDRRNLLEGKLKAEQDGKDRLILESASDGDVKTKMAELNMLLEKNEEMNAQHMKHSELLAEKQALEAESAKLESEHSRLKSELQLKKETLAKKAELLENSGCIDPDNASCKFLADAVDAKKKLAVIDSEYEGQLEEIARKIMNLADNILTVGGAIERNNYDKAEHLQIKQRIDALYAQKIPERCEAISTREQEITIHDKKIELLTSDIEDAKKREADLMAKLEQLQKELKSVDYNPESTEELRVKIEYLAPYEDKAKQIPLYEERLRVTKERIAELLINADEVNADIEQRTQRLESIEDYSDRIESIKILIESGQKELEAIQNNISNLQREIGALEHKEEEAVKLSKDIKELTARKAKYGAETADYDILKACFTQDGIPHQIIRSVLPQITATANSILGQMTGGKMGIEIVTEKVLKSNTNKEVTALDVVIEEYGKSILPYLSKSGGEKVKASLAVILALAEVKSSSAGVRLGMLFIDEAPFLDSDGTQAYTDALFAIRERYAGIKVMAITHDPTFKARFSQSITVTKDENGSHVWWD